MNWGYLFIFVSVGLDQIGSLLVLPIVPRLFESWGLGDHTEYYGMYSALYPAMQFFFAPLFGGLSDTVGRRPVLLLSNIGKAVDFLLMSQAFNLHSAMIARAVAGVVGTSVGPARAYLGDVMPPEKRGQAFTTLNTVLIVGSAIGPLIGGYLAEIDLYLPFRVAAYVAFANFILGTFFLRESLAKENRTKLKWNVLNPFAAIAGMYASRPLAVAARSLFFGAFAQFAFQAIFVQYAAYRFGWTASQLGWWLAISSVTGVAVLAYSPRIKIPEKNLLTIGVVAGFLDFALVGLATQSWMIFAAIIPGAISALADPILQTRISKNTTVQGATQGALSSLIASAKIAAPVLATAFFSATMKNPILPGLSILGLGLLYILGLSGREATKV